MQMPDENESPQTLETELQECIDEMKRIIDNSETAQSLQPKDAVQAKSHNIDQVNFFDHGPYLAKAGKQVGRKIFFPHTIGLRGRLLGKKTPSPQKRTLSDLNSDDSPLRYVYWQFPNKPPFATGLARRLEDALKADESIFEDSSAISSKSSPEEFSRGHSPSPRQNKSQKVSPRFLSEPDKPGSPLRRSPPFNWSQSLGLESMPQADVNSPQKRSSPKTQILQSQPNCEQDPSEKVNYLHKKLTELNNQYKKIIEDECKQITILLKHSRALLPKKINLDAQEKSLSHWMSDELFDLLSLSCLREITILITRTYIGLEELQKNLKALDISGCEDDQLFSIYNQISASVDNAINEDIQFLKSASKSLNIYEMQSRFFTQYFGNIDNESSVINQLYELAKNSNTLSVGYLEENPTLVRIMVESSFQFIKGIPQSTNRIQYYSTIFPALINNLVSITQEYDAEKNYNRQHSQPAF